MRLQVPTIPRGLAVGAAALLAGALLAACAAQTPYAPRDGSNYGFSEVRIESNRYRVGFSGNSLTDQETVETYLLYRAAELTLEQGYDWFEIVDRGTEASRRVVGARPYPGYGRGFNYRYFHPAYGWYPWYDPFWDDIDVREVTRYEASAEIYMGKGDKPDEPRAYDARQVQMNLGPNITYPTS